MNAQELLRQALEALKAGADVDPIFAGETIDDLRAALAQPEHEEAALDEEKRREKILRRLNVLEATNLGVEETLIVNHKEIMRLIDISKDLSARIREVEMQQRNKGAKHE